MCNICAAETLNLPGCVYSFISCSSGCFLQVRKKQQTIIDALDVRGIEYDAIDVSAPENEEGKLFMREHAKAKGGQPNALPPQVFYGEEYVGVSIMFAVNYLA